MHGLFRPDKLYRLQIGNVFEKRRLLQLSRELHRLHKFVKLYDVQGRLFIKKRKVRTENGIKLSVLHDTFFRSKMLYSEIIKEATCEKHHSSS